jgi:hypothetical protein
LPARRISRATLSNAKQRIGFPGALFVFQDLLSKIIENDYSLFVSRFI